MKLVNVKKHSLDSRLPGFGIREWATLAYVRLPRAPMPKLSFQNKPFS